MTLASHVRRGTAMISPFRITLAIALAALVIGLTAFALGATKRVASVDPGQVGVRTRLGAVEGTAARQNSFLHSAEQAHAAGVRAVARIREQIAAGDYGGIHREASGEARELSTEDELRAVLTAVRDLGVPITAQETGWEVRTDAGRTLVTLKFQSTFDGRRQLIETFALVAEDSTFRLVGYDNDLP
jgi:hypothetical protein